MSSKVKSSEGKLPVLKGQEAEDAVLDYMKRMNRPFGAVDVSANLKGAVPKAATQKILLSLAEKGHVVQKLYGKTTFFVANQANLEDIPPEKLAALEKEYNSIQEENKVLSSDLKTKQADLAKIKNTPTDAQLASQIEETTVAINKLKERLEPLRSGAPLVSPEDLAQLDKDWSKSRAEWVRRKKIFYTFWSIVTDALTPQEATTLAQDLGIEFDTPEHIALERGPLCVPPSSLRGSGSVLGKRRR